MAFICLIAIAYLYFMIYLGMRKRKINAIDQVNDSLINAKMESKIGGMTALLTAALICSFLPSIGITLLGTVYAVFYNKFVVPFNGGTGAIELASESSFVLIQRPKDSHGCAGAFSDLRKRMNKPQ